MRIVMMGAPFPTPCTYFSVIDSSSYYVVTMVLMNLLGIEIRYSHFRLSCNKWMNCRSGRTASFRKTINHGRSPKKISINISASHDFRYNKNFILPSPVINSLKVMNGAVGEAFDYLHFSW